MVTCFRSRFDHGLKFRSDGCFMENMLSALLPAVGNKIRRYYLICQRRCDSGVTARVVAGGKQGLHRHVSRCLYREFLRSSPDLCVFSDNLSVP